MPSEKKRKVAWDRMFDAPVKFAKQNPRRPDTKAFYKFALYSQCATIGEALGKGARYCDLDFDWDHDSISFSQQGMPLFVKHAGEEQALVTRESPSPHRNPRGSRLT